MKELRYVASSEQATERLGKILAELLPVGTVVALHGTLGAGKTRLVQAVAAALGVPDKKITSPTFVLVNEYSQGRLPVYHFDAYRLADEDEFLELGPDEYFEAEGITFIEWAERVARCLPAEHLAVRIEVLGETQREFFLSASVPELEPLVEAISQSATAS